ncbi:MAG TPA: hypothetical protein VIE89_25770 [Candidatus Binatia bacterium]
MMHFGSAKRNCRQLNSDLKGMLALMRAVPEFFSERLNLQRAQEEIKRDLDHREEKFLSLVHAQIYGRADSPYLKLLKLARCEFSDLRTQVRRFGLERTLKQLAEEGVYLTADEFKGKKEVLRGGKSFRVTASHFECPDSTAGYRTQSSGTSNQPIRSFVSLNLLAIRAPVTYLFFAAHNLFSHSHAMYDAILPGSAGINNLLIYARMGVVADRWFARKIPINNKIEATYHSLMTLLVTRAAQHIHRGFPKPEFLESDQIEQIVHWVEDQRSYKKACCITTAASNAARIARAADRLAIPLDQTRFIVSGEPFTESKRKVIERTGARATTRYAYGGSINIGFGCANPLHTDEIHVNQHLVALLPNPRPLENGGSSFQPLVCTTLHPSFPRLLFNVESGDYGYLTQRDCGCALGNIGLSLHLHHIRSFEKFTSEGMNYFYGDLFELVEKILPAEFGGGPGDYQLVEEEDGRGQTRLSLMVHPTVGELDESRLLARLQEGLAQGSRGNLFMSRLWQDSGTFRIKRAIPHASGRGKILPLHIVH